MRMRFWLTVMAAVAVLAVLAMGCGDDDDDDTGDGGGQGSAEDIATVEQLVRDLVGSDATQQADVDFFFEHVTDDLLEGGLFQTTREDCMANAVDCIGEPSDVKSIENTTVSGDDASTDVTLDFGNFTFVLVKDGEAWKVTQLKALSQDIPADVTAVTLQLNEFAFGFNRSDIEDGNFAFASENIGKQNHQVIVVKLDEGVVLDEALQYEGDGTPPGVTDVASAAPISPGDQVNVVFEEPLDAGRYALICFFPDTEDPEQTPHAFKGMQAEFEVPAE